MAAKKDQFNNKDANIIGKRVAEFLKRKYPESPAKQVAYEFGVSRQTAELWLNGKNPTIRHLYKMKKKYDMPFIEYVFADEFELDVALAPAASAFQPETLSTRLLNWVGLSTTTSNLAGRIMLPASSEFKTLAERIRRLMNQALRTADDLPKPKTRANLEDADSD